MKFAFPLFTLLLLGIALPQVTTAEDSSRVVIWSITASSKAPTLAEARELHQARLAGVLQQQSHLNLADEDVFVGPPELDRLFYRTIPKGYEIRQAVYLRQRDTSQFDEAFKTLAPQDSPAIGVGFRFTAASWRPPVELKPTVVVWKVTVAGGGKTLVESKEQFEARMSQMRTLLEGFDIAEIKYANPWMHTVPEQLQEDERPKGYTFLQTLTFQQTDMQQFDALLDKFTELDSEYLHVRFTLEAQK